MLDAPRRGECFLPPIHILALLILSFFSLAAQSAPLIKDIRISSSPDGTRVVFDLSEAVEQKLFTLDKPDRVVLDLSKAQLQLAGTLPSSTGFIKTTRTSKRDNGDLRVVFDVSNAVQARVFAVAAAGDLGPRLVVDLLPQGMAMSEPPGTSIAAVPVAAAVAAAPQEPAPKPMVKAREPVIETGRDLIIAIDAGHGGEDPGAIGRRGTQEKSVTLAIAHQLKEKIDAEAGMRAVLTRDGDYFVPLRGRIERARKHQANMFISIHADSVPDRSVTGSSVFVLSSRRASNEAARYLADRENAADLLGGVSLDDKSSLLASVLLDLQQGVTMSASAEAANKVLKGLDRIGNVHHVSVQQASFMVLTSPDIPSMLVETAFISNASEESKLTDTRHQDRLANAILDGVRDYFYDNPPPGTRVAQLKALRQASAAATKKTEIVTVY